MKKINDSVKAREIQELWAYIHNDVLAQLEGLLTNSKNIKFVQVCQERCRIARSANWKNQKTTFLFFIHICYLLKYIEFPKNEINVCKNNIKRNFLGISKFVIKDNMFFHLLHSITPSTLQQLSINNWFRRAGFRPIGNSWISFWDPSNTSSKGMIYHGPRK